MNLLIGLAAAVLLFIALLVGFTALSAWWIAAVHPPVGTFAEIGGRRLHYVHVRPETPPTLPPVVFVHGASGNLLDQMLPLRPLLEGRAELLFVDRPGHGWSGRGKSDDTPSEQAAAIAALLEHLGIRSPIVVGHSFGGSVAAALAVEHPQIVSGLVFLSAATHPWPGGATSWYYDVAARPGLGPLFAWTVANPAGLMRLDGATTCVFAPNPVPDGYVRRAGIPLVLRPAAFRANAIDVEALYPHVSRLAPLYSRITAPTVVISGDSDTVVYEEIHSLGLARDIPGAKLAWVRNLGHKPDWTVPELVVAAVEKVAGMDVDLDAAVQAAERRVASHRFGEHCRDEKVSSPELAPG